MTAQECPIDLPPEPLVIDADNIDNNVLYVHQLGETDSEFAAPIDIDVVAATAIDLPLLEWHNYEVMPRKMRLTNTGKTRKTCAPVMREKHAQTTIYFYLSYIKLFVITGYYIFASCAVSSIFFGYKE